MIGGVVEANGRVIATHREIEVVVLRVLQQVTFEVDAELVGFSSGNAVDIVWAALKHNFTQELELFRDIGRDKQVESAQREGAVGAGLITSVKCDVSEPADAQQGLAHVHAFGLEVLRFLLLMRLRFRCG